MTPTHNRPPPSTPRQLTMRQAAQTLGISLGQFMLRRSRGSSLFDANFPTMVNQLFDQASVEAYRDALATGPISQAPTSLPEPAHRGSAPTSVEPKRREHVVGERQAPERRTATRRDGDRWPS